MVYRRKTRNPHRGMNSKRRSRAHCGRSLARSHGPFDALFVGTEMGVLVDKASETMAAV